MASEPVDPGRAESLLRRHDGTAASIHVLTDGAYQRTDRSVAVPGLDADTLTGMLADGLKHPLGQWLRTVRAWAGVPPPR